MAGSIEKRSKGHVSSLDTALIAAAVIGGIFVVLWLAKAVVGFVLFGLKVVVLVVVVAVAIRLVHLFTRSRD